MTRAKPVILYREEDHLDKSELNAAREHFNIYHNRALIPSYSTVIGRYSVLPYYSELDKDLACSGSNLINTYSQHRYIANFNYYEDVKEHTFETWDKLVDIPNEGSFVVKGRTNSRKARWNTHMFAVNRARAIEVATELMQDPMIDPQGIIIRRYEELEFIEEGINGQPFVNEHRCFFYRENLIATGFYWFQSEKSKEIDQEGIDFAYKIAKIISNKTNFFVLDIAKNKQGNWRLVEVNDGQMSGLCTINPNTFYSTLAKQF